MSSAAAANPLSLSKLFYSGGLSTDLNNANLHPGLLSNLLNSSVQFPSMSGDLPSGLTTSAAVDTRVGGSTSPGSSPAAMEVDAT